VASLAASAAPGAARSTVHTIEIKSSHAAMVSYRKAVTGLVLAAARDR
jgi:hypothetical protein